MTKGLHCDCLADIVAGLASFPWSLRYLDTVGSSDGSGAVTGAAEHFDALRKLGHRDLGDTPPPPRFCIPSGLDD